MTATTAVPGGQWAAQVPEFARRLGEAARARRVVLFGSAARGDMAERSDLDFLVIIPPGRHWRRAWRRAYDAAGGLNGPALDIVVAREAMVRKWRDCPYLIYKPALDEGVEVWRAAGAAADDGGGGGVIASRGMWRAWLRRAEGEFAHARRPLGAGLAVECFYAYRAMENAVKAVYVSRRIAHPYTRQLGPLLDGLEQRGIAVPASAREAGGLTVYATARVYPDSKAVAAAEHAEVVRVAAEVLEWAKAEIARAGAK